MNTLFHNVLTASFHGSIVILVVLFLRLFLKKAPKKFLCFLWLLAGIRLLMPFEIQSSLSLQPESATAAVQQWQPEHREEPVFSYQPPAEAPASRPGNLPVVKTEGTSPTAVPDTPANVSAAPSAAPAEPEKPSFDWTGLIPYIWLAVAGCIVIYSLYSYLRLKYQVREAIKIPGGWECDRIETAFILGFIRPQIYIPMGMYPSVRKHILAHERTHLEKGDHWFKMIGFIALAIHWFNPLVWVAYILLCKDIEMACDERVVQFMDLNERKSYSAALLSCSTNRAHFAACPVAFGEVSVKQRIKSVLNYRRPSFWISLLGVIAIVFVAVCLLTNPVEEQDAAAGETIPTETTEALTEEQKEQKILTKEEELQQRVLEGLDSMLNADTGSIQLLATNEGDYSIPWQCAYFLHGDDRMWMITDARDGYTQIQHMILDGNHYSSKDELWIASEAAADPMNEVKQWFNWEDIEELYGFSESETTMPDGYSYSQIKFSGYRGSNQISFTFTFNADGSFSGGSVTGLKSEYGDELSISSYPADRNEVENRFAAAAEVAMTLEKYEENKIPSNYTQYDKDFMLGSGQMRWHYFDQKWQFALGAENAASTGLTLVYRESDNDHQSLTAEEGFWIEKLVDGKWTIVEPIAEVTNAPAKKINVSWTAQDRVNINWADSYGVLSYGFYRLGRYHTVAMPSGESETQHCYAKFRLYDPNQDVLLRKCQSALDTLLSSSSYHIYSFDWMIQHDYEYYLSIEAWKQGQNFLEVTKYPLRENTSEMMKVGGSMWRDGKYYGLEWSGEPTVSPVSSWWLGADGYVDNSNFDIWTFGFQWYDGKVEEVIQEGNMIHILETYDFDDKYQCTELTLTFDDSGNLKGMIKAYLPTRHCAQKDKVISEEMVVFDTTANEIDSLIRSQDISTPIPFSYAEDVAKYPDAQTSGFKNSTAKAVSTAAGALALADKECAMETIEGFNKGYFQSQTYYDEEAKMWKVELFWWQDDNRYQAVYLNDQGITQMMVTGQH